MKLNKLLESVLPVYLSAYIYGNCLPVKGSIKTIELNVSTGWNVTFIFTGDKLHKDSSSFSLFFNSNTIATFYPDGKPPNVMDIFPGRLDVSSFEKLVTLMNLQKPDSGLYSAEVTEQTEPFKQYKVRVQDGVSSVNLTDPMCNITIHEWTVTCSTGDFIISGTLTPPNKNKVQHPFTPEGSIKQLHVILGVGGGLFAAGVLAAGVAGVVLWLIRKKCCFSRVSQDYELGVMA